MVNPIKAIALSPQPTVTISGGEQVNIIGVTFNILIDWDYLPHGRKFTLQKKTVILTRITFCLLCLLLY